MRPGGSRNAFGRRVQADGNNWVAGFVAGINVRRLGPVADCVTLVTPLSVLRTENMPERGRSVLYGLTMLAILLTHGRERRTT